jgi:hypothetical protein
VAALTSAEYFLGPLLLAVLLGGLALMLRWTFSRGGSLVRRTDDSPAARDAFGLLVDVRTTRSYAEARTLVERLTKAGIKATAARTTEGWTVYVWPADEPTARQIVNSS